jgi:hypothetical protein
MSRKPAVKDYVNSVLGKVQAKKGIAASQKEADASSANPQVLRARESNSPIKIVKFRESGSSSVVGKSTSAKGDSVIYDVILIKEGLGNLVDLFFYTKDALKSAVSLMEGHRGFANHPSKIEDETRPERSVLDIFGHYEDLKYSEAADGRGQVGAKAKVMAGETAIIERMDHAIEYSKKYPDKDFVGLSINASGGASEISIDDLKRMNLPESCLPKILEAEAKGVTKIKLVSKFSDAVSIDLVTEAGAGGRINSQLKENNKTQKESAMAESEAETKKREEEAKKKAEAEATPPPPAAKDAPPADGDHADKDQDVELVKKMMKQYLGDKEQVSEEEAAVVKEAYEAHREMGHKEEEAMGKACEFMKTARHLASKKKESECRQAEAEAESKKREEESKKEAEAMESAKVKEAYIKLKGENASLRESLKKVDVVSEIEKVCRESKRSNSITKEFKDLAKDCKSVEEVNRAWKLFERGLSSIQGESHFQESIIAPEKLAFRSEGSSGLNLAGCVID